ncbi:MAG: AmmeMemoRadiSam system radical SAM enzyme [Eubacterium sp.]|nr:AmmeMemoRadiSam system radical SAM enzyme [Eubacterium sp.]
MSRCNVCFRHCRIPEGGRGFCGARICKDGNIIPENYGKITSMALDPIEKKPLKRFHPGSLILSVGSYGCNLRCPFCQNYEISWSDHIRQFQDQAQDSGEPCRDRHTEYISPEELAMTALYYQNKGNIGIAYTYNEPMIGYEYIRDCAMLVHEQGMKNVLVTNGTAELNVLGEILPYIDAMNIDLKGFNHNYYNNILRGDLDMVLSFIKEAVKYCHVELTTLIVPGENDSVEEIRQIARWISSLEDGKGQVIGQDIPLHVSRFFPRFHMTDRAATQVDKVYDLAGTAREYLRYVYTGNC